MAFDFFMIKYLIFNRIVHRRRASVIYFIKFGSNQIYDGSLLFQRHALQDAGDAYRQIWLADRTLNGDAYSQDAGDRRIADHGPSALLGTLDQLAHSFDRHSPVFRQHVFVDGKYLFYFVLLQALQK